MEVKRNGGSRATRRGGLHVENKATATRASAITTARTPAEKRRAGHTSPHVWPVATSRPSNQIR